jgi:hypothetical protein
MSLIRHRFVDGRGKYIFVPTDECVRIGKRIIRFVERSANFPDYFYHFRPGGHVAALHNHLENRYFFRIDLKDFFYSISRNRVAKALRAVGYNRARCDAKSSSVRSPLNNGVRYALPIGFVQSPILASLVLLNSDVANVLREASMRRVCVSVYLDDLIGSGREMEAVSSFYDDLRVACERSNFLVNTAKLTPPSVGIVAFNCDLRLGNASVTADRIARFMNEPRSEVSIIAFDRYVMSVSRNNWESYPRP